jgi:hypothetical protein
MRPGQVTTDDQAFRQVLKRLEDECGAIVRLVEKHKGQGGFPNTAPFWALVRMLFPIAESIGDLMYRNDKSTVNNLTSVLANEFEVVRRGYNRMANILAVLYRHSLTHQDEMRGLLTGGNEVAWIVSYGVKAHHLEVKKCPVGITLQFDTCGFYDDIVDVCKAAIPKAWGGLVRDRYNSWLTLDLDGKPDKYKQAIKEITGLIQSTK